MSLFTQSNYIQYQQAGGVTVFPFPDLVYETSDMQVYGLDPITGTPTLYALDTDYTIDTAQLGQSTGIDIVFLVAPDDGTIISIYRIVPYIQPVILPNNTPLPGQVVERNMDKIVMMCQQLQQLIAKAQVPGALPDGDYIPYDLSAGGVPQIGITPGNHRDSTGGNIIVPKINGVLLTAVPAPIMVLGSTDVVLYFRFPVDPNTGILDKDNSDILPGTSVPSDTESYAYQLLSNCQVNNPGTDTSVTKFGGGVTGSQNYTYCGALPATDGSGHQFNA